MKQGGKFFLALSLFAVATFFCLSKPVQAEANIIISEIAWMGTASSSFAEWLELANPTDSDIALEGWSLKAGGWTKVINLSGTIKAHDYYLLERTREETLPGIAADVIYTGDLKNSGDLLELKDASGSIIDFLDAITGWPGGDNANKLTLERLSDLTWASSTVPGGTPRAQNSLSPILIVFPPTEAPTNTPPNPISSSTPSPAVNSTPINLPQAVVIAPGEIVINELVSDPLDGESEWVELFLVADKTIDLAGSTLEDGSQSKTSLSGILSPNKRFMVVENPNGNLNNSGDLLLLRSANKTIVDQLAYGEWANGQFNAPVARDGASLARRFDGMNTFNALADWAISKQPTKQTANLIASDEDGAVIQAVNPKALIITELLADPRGDESEEFVELYNQSESVVSLAGWRLQTKSGQIYRFATSSVIGVHEYLAVFRKDTHLVLVNDSGSLKLLAPGSDRASQSVSYKNGQAGQSYGRNGDGLWQWTESPTPGTINRFTRKNQPPVPAIYVKTSAEVGEIVYFDSTDTVDPEDDTLKYSWQFGDGASSSLANPDHVFFKKGNYHIKLTVSDGQASAVTNVLIKISAKNSQPPIGTTTASATMKNNLVINEVVPNPTGSDDSEWLELYNQSDETINLFGFTLDDGVDGSSPYKISEELLIGSKEYLIFERSETDLAFNNNADEVRLLESNGQLVTATGYQKAEEGLVWARTATGDYAWSVVPTPGSANIIKMAENSKAQAKSSAKQVKGQKINNSSDQEVGDEAVFECVATSLPGQLASQYFYCENDRGWQIYNYKKDFPAINIGDLLEARGLVSQTNGNWRLKIRDQASLKKLGQKSITIEQIALEDVGPAYYGKLVRLQGEATKKSGSSFYLDDNTAEAVIQLKATAGLSTANISIGDTYEVAGVLQASQSGLKILPRSKEDLRRHRPEASLGELATGTETWLSTPNRAKGYAVVAGSSTVLLFGLWAMKRLGLKF